MRSFRSDAAQPIDRAPANNCTAGTLYDMLARLAAFARWFSGARTITVEQETADRLVLRYGGLRTTFDKASSQILQNGRLVGVLRSVERIELHTPSQYRGMRFVTVHLTQARQVEVGRVSDDTDASLVAARIASITDRPVVIHP